MTEKTTAAVDNNLVNLGNILKLVQVGNLHGNISVHLSDTAHTRTEALIEEYQRYLVDTFSPAEPDTFRQFQQAFTEKRTAVLTGEPGNGRETAAIALHATCGLRVHSVPLDESPRARLAGTFPEPGHGYLIDLSDLPIDKSTIHELRALGDRATANRAGLTIVTQPGQLTGDLHEFPVLTVSRPSGINVLSRHLHYLLGERKMEAWTTWEDVRKKMRHAGPADAVRLARIAYQSYPDDEITCAETWIRRALSAYGDWKSELNSWFAEHSGSEAVWDRIVLISVAFLEGRETHEVFDAADALARVLDIRPGDAGGLSGLGVDPTLEAVGATRAQNNRTYFTRPEYADAVLEYTWEQLPRLQEHLFSWARELISNTNAQVAEHVRDTCVHLALSRKDQKLTVSFFDQWSQTTNTIDVAASFAAKIASSPTLGRAMRSRLYEIAKNRPDGQPSVAVARACSSYGRENTSSALVRLKWLAQSGSERTRQEALRSLESLAKEPNLWFEVVGSVLNGWCHEGVATKRRETAFRLLSRALESSSDGVPNLLQWAKTHLDSIKILEYVAGMWGVILDQADVSLTQTAAEVWLSCAFENTSLFEDVATILSKAVSGDGRALGEGARNRRTVTAGKMIVDWCEHHGADIGHSSVYNLQARLFNPHGPKVTDAGDSSLRDA